MNCLCRSAFLVSKSNDSVNPPDANPHEQLAQKGRYEEALSRMDEADREALRTLKYQQHWTANLGILKLQRLLHRRVFWYLSAIFH